MPEVSVTKGAKQMGWQTYAKAQRIKHEGLRELELEYLNMRDWYTNQLSHLAQWEEALAQAERAKDRDRIDECKHRVGSIQGVLRDARTRVKDAGQRSWAEAFYLVAEGLLPPEAQRVLREEADHLVGRPRDELRTSRR